MYRLLSRLGEFLLMSISEKHQPKRRLGFKDRSCVDRPRSRNLALSGNHHQHGDLSRRDRRRLRHSGARSLHMGSEALLPLIAPMPRRCRVRRSARVVGVPDPGLSSCTFVQDSTRVLRSRIFLSSIGDPLIPYTGVFSTLSQVPPPPN